MQRFRWLLLANLILKSLHIRLITEENHLEEVRLSQFDLLNIEAHLIQLLLK